MKEELPHQAVDAENAAAGKSRPVIDQQGAHRRELNLIDQISKRCALRNRPWASWPCCLSSSIQEAISLPVGGQDGGIRHGAGAARLV